MIDVGKYEKIGECRNNKMIWFSPKKENIVYLIMFGKESYVGSCKNIHRRFSQYVPALTRRKYEAKKVQNAFNLNKGFDVYAIEFASPDNLREKERYYLNMLHPSLNTRTTVSYMYREAIKKVEKKGLIGVQTKIPISMYHRLNKQKELRGESICDMVSQAIAEWLNLQNINEKSFIEYNQDVQRPTKKRASSSQRRPTKKRASSSPYWKLSHIFKTGK